MTTTELTGWKARKRTRWEKRLAESRALKEKVIKLLAQGMSQSNVANKVGVTRQRICQISQEVNS